MRSHAVLNGIAVLMLLSVVCSSGKPSSGKKSQTAPECGSGCTEGSLPSFVQTMVQNINTCLDQTKVWAVSGCDPIILVPQSNNCTQGIKKSFTWRQVEIEPPATGKTKTVCRIRCVPKRKPGKTRNNVKNVNEIPQKQRYSSDNNHPKSGNNDAEGAINIKKEDQNVTAPVESSPHKSGQNESVKCTTPGRDSMQQAMCHSSPSSQEHCKKKGKNTTEGEKASCNNKGADFCPSLVALNCLACMQPKSPQGERNVHALNNSKYSHCSMKITIPSLCDHRFQLTEEQMKQLKDISLSDIQSLMESQRKPKVVQVEDESSKQITNYIIVKEIGNLMVGMPCDDGEIGTTTTSTCTTWPTTTTFCKPPTPRPWPAINDNVGYGPKSTTTYSPKTITPKPNHNWSSYNEYVQYTPQTTTTPSPTSPNEGTQTHHSGVSNVVQGDKRGITCNPYPHQCIDRPPFEHCLEPPSYLPLEGDGQSQFLHCIEAMANRQEPLAGACQPQGSVTAAHLNRSGMNTPCEQYQSKELAENRLQNQWNQRYQGQCQNNQNYRDRPNIYNKGNCCPYENERWITHDQSEDERSDDNRFGDHDHNAATRAYNDGKLRPSWNPRTHSKGAPNVHTFSTPRGKQTHNGRQINPNQQQAWHCNEKIYQPSKIPGNSHQMAQQGDWRQQWTPAQPKPMRLLPATMPGYLTKPPQKYTLVTPSSRPPILDFQRDTPNNRGFSQRNVQPAAVRAPMYRQVQPTWRRTQQTPNREYRVFPSQQLPGNNCNYNPRLHPLAIDRYSNICNPLHPAVAPPLGYSLPPTFKIC